MYRNKKTGIIGIAITIIVLIVLVLLTNIKLGSITGIQNAFSKLVMPVQNGLTYLKNKISGNNAFFEDINNLKSENENLRKENEKLEEKLRDLEIIKAENATLRNYNNMSEKYTDYTTVPAYVIDKDTSNYNKTIIINIGKNDGIEVNMPVISNKGLVGHVISVTSSTAKVQTIVDTSSSTSCTLSSSRDTILARGTLENDTLLKATYIPAEATVMQGETIETSGLGGIYPKGILVGTIDKVVTTKNITDRYATINTAVDFSKIETVLVITK